MDTSPLDGEIDIIFMDEDVEDPCESFMQCDMVAIWDVYVSCGCPVIALCEPCRKFTEDQLARAGATTGNKTLVTKCIRCNSHLVTVTFKPHKRK